EAAVEQLSIPWATLACKGFIEPFSVFRGCLRWRRNHITCSHSVDDYGPNEKPRDSYRRGQKHA
ncbi:hypothetical protein, partial [Polaribacter sargassicola]|uniref:hypothetical protein n=1 Tax=Polaribacter sargassicola TaxID=2836891 RepID=UPI001F3D889B